MTYSDYGCVNPLFDRVAQNAEMTIALPAEPLHDHPVAVAVNPDFPDLALITPVGMNPGETGCVLRRVGQAYGDDRRDVAAVYGRDVTQDVPPEIGDAMRLASRPPGCAIRVNSDLVREALNLFEPDATIELAFIESESPDREPWEALRIAPAHGKTGNTAIIAPVACLTNTGRCEPTPVYDRPDAPWLNAAIPDEDPDDGDVCWLAVKGRKGWNVFVATYDEALSNWVVGAKRDPVFGWVNHRDLEVYHCPNASFIHSTAALESLP